MCTVAGCTVQYSTVQLHWFTSPDQRSPVSPTDTPDQSVTRDLQLRCLQWSERRGRREEMRGWSHLYILDCVSLPGAGDTAVRWSPA